MLVILSPAKMMNMKKSSEIVYSSVPYFQKEAENLVSHFKGCDVLWYKNNFKISETLAEKCKKFYDNFFSSSKKQAIHAYTGTVFKRAGFVEMSSDELEIVNKQFRIISTLYGVLKPFDMISEYRLEYGIKVPKLGESLYEYWNKRQTDFFLHDAKSRGGVVIDLASLDVRKSFDFPLLEKELSVYHIEFNELKEGKLLNVRTYAKMARGEMSKYIVKNRISDPQLLKAFEWEGFVFNREFSSEKNFVFTRMKKDM